MEIEVFTQTIGGTIAVRLPSQVADAPHIAEIRADVETSTAETFNTYSDIPVRREHKAHVTITLDIDTTMQEGLLFAEYLRDGKLGSLAFISQPTTKKETK